MELARNMEQARDMELNSYRNKYKIKELLGRGATAQVYLAKAIQTGEPVAIKVSENCTMLERESQLLKEASKESQLPEEVQGENQFLNGVAKNVHREQLPESAPTVRIFPQWVDYFEVENGKRESEEGKIEKEENGEEESGRKKTGYLVMEYMEGGSLKTLLEKQGRLPVERAADIALELLKCLQTLHNQTVPLIYRDIKPENIMFDQNGRLRLVDAASVLPGRYRVGTYGYAAPEQFWDGVKLGPESDLYAVGKLLAYMLTGKNPGEPPYDMLQYCAKDRRVSPPFFQVIQRSLAVEGMGRYASAEAFSRELKLAVRESRRLKWRFFEKKHKINYEKCIWKSEYQRIF